MLVEGKKGGKKWKQNERKLPHKHASKLHSWIGIGKVLRKIKVSGCALEASS